MARCGYPAYTMHQYKSGQIRHSDALMEAQVYVRGRNWIFPIGKRVFSAGAEPQPPSHLAAYRDITLRIMSGL